MSFFWRLKALIISWQDNEVYSEPAAYFYKFYLFSMRNLIFQASWTLARENVKADVKLMGSKAGVHY